jgi:hypothetical protein
MGTKNSYEIYQELAKKSTKLGMESENLKELLGKIEDSNAAID